MIAQKQLAFLLGSFQTGDGMSDYTTTLAASLTKSGVNCGIIVLNQPSRANGSQCEDGVEELLPVGEAIEIPFVQLNADSSWNQRLNISRNALKRWGAEAVSLQFNFHKLGPKGIISAFAKTYPSIVQGRRTHWMVHELWSNPMIKPRWKEVLKGWVRLPAFVRMIRKRVPDETWTPAYSYQRKLRRLGLDAKWVPAFSNVPRDSSSLDWAWMAIGAALRDQTNRSKYFIALLFGTIHPTWKPERLIHSLSGLAGKQGKQLVIVHVGRNGYTDHWNGVVARNAHLAKFVSLGEVLLSQLSAAFFEADIGLSHNPWKISEKSCSLAALRLHGLPVFFAEPIPPAGEFDPLSANTAGIYFQDSELQDWTSVARGPNGIDSALSHSTNEMITWLNR